MRQEFTAWWGRKARKKAPAYSPEVVIKGNSIRRDLSGNRRSMSVVVLASGDGQKLSAPSMSIERHTGARDQLY
jgi:hypothetical protein